MGYDQSKNKKQRKIDKHVDIVVNEKKAKILNYKLSEYTDEYTGEKKQTIELITKIQNALLQSKTVDCYFSKGREDVKFTGNWYRTFTNPGLFKYFYNIDTISITENASAAPEDQDQDEQEQEESET